MNQRHIKISDLLRTTGKTDTIEFVDKLVDGMPEVLSPGVSGRIYLTCLNNSCIEVILENIKCNIEDISDISGKKFIRDIDIESYDVLFCLPEKKGTKETNIDIYSSFSDIYNINEKDTSIDILPCIINAIKSQEPLVKLSDDEKMLDGGEYDE